jgi:hypothetical protein
MVFSHLYRHIQRGLAFSGQKFLHSSLFPTKIKSPPISFHFIWSRHEYVVKSINPHTFHVVYCVFTGCLVTASNAIDPSTSVFMASHLRWVSLSHFTQQPSPLHSLTPRLEAIPHQPYLLTPISRLSHNRSCSSLYSVGTDSIENTCLNSSSIVTSHSYRTGGV